MGSTPKTDSRTTASRSRTPSTTRSSRISSVTRIRRPSKRLARKDFNSLRATQTLPPKSMRPNRRRSKQSSLLSCRKSTKLQVALQAVCPVPEECHQVVCQTWEVWVVPQAEEHQMPETSMISTETKIYVN